MAYTFDRTLQCSFDEAITRVTRALREEGFGILTEIDVAATLKKKIDVDFRPYRILGACNPPLAHEALLSEPNIGAMLPCNVIVQQAPDGDQILVSVIDPVASMISVENPSLGAVAEQVRGKLRAVVESL